MPKYTKHEMSSVDCFKRIARFERKIVKELLTDAQRPALANYYNHHPEILDSLIEKANFNKRYRFPASHLKRFFGC